MGFRHVLHLIISMSVCAANSDSTSLLSSDTAFSSSAESLAFKQSDSSLNLFSSSSDVSDLPFEDTNNRNLFSSDNLGLEDTNNKDLFLLNNVGLDDRSKNDLFPTPDIKFDDGYVEMADCMSSKAFSVIGKSRIKRRDASDLCTDSGTGPFKSQDLPSAEAGDGQSSSRKLGIFSPLRDILDTTEYKRRHNEICLSVTWGALPWGVCYQPTEVPLKPIGSSVIPPDSGGTVYPSYIVDPCTLGKCKSGTKFSIC